MTNTAAARRIAFLGPAGTFSEEAAHAYGEATHAPFTLLPFSSFSVAAQAVETGIATDAILAFENSLEGAVSSTLDVLIHETPLRIRGEVILPVRHFLWVAPGADITTVRRVISHPQGIGQCRRFLDRLLPGVATAATLSTAGAVEQVMREGTTDTAAIAGRRAGEVYGATLLASDIQDEKRNFTRFIALGSTDAAPTGADKTSLVFTVPQNVPGSLYEGLGAFARSNIQLFHIESRPQRQRLGEYYFVIELEGHREDPAIAEALGNLRTHAESVTVFGSYPAAPLPG